MLARCLARNRKARVLYLLIFAIKGEYMRFIRGMSLSMYGRLELETNDFSID